MVIRTEQAVFTLEIRFGESGRRNLMNVALFEALKVGLLEVQNDEYVRGGETGCLASRALGQVRGAECHSLH